MTVSEERIEPDETPTPESEPETDPGETPEPEEEEPGTEGDETPESDSEPFLKIDLGDGELTFKSREEAIEAIREREYLKRRMPDLGRENKELRERAEQGARFEAQLRQLQPFLNDEAVKKAILAKHYGVAPDLLENSSDPALAQALSALLPKLSDLERRVEQQQHQYSSAALEKSYQDYLSDNKDVQESPVMQKLVGEMVEYLDPPAERLRDPAGLRKILNQATKLARAEMSPKQIREQTDKAIRDAMAKQKTDQDKNRKLAAVVGKGSGKVSVGKINPTEYEPGIKGSTKLTMDILDREHGKSAGRGG